MRRLPLLSGALLLLLAGCGGWQSILDPRNPGAARIESLWWIVFVGTAVLSTLVIGGLAVALLRALGRASADEEHAGAAREDRVILLGGALVPGLFLVGFLALTVRTGTAVSEPAGDADLLVEVVGHQFWWEIRYPESGVVTANELHVPTGRTVEVRVTSADVVHSFWVPKLAPGKVDMNPGRTNRIRILADEDGLYRGQCTEFCGVQHALMSLLVIASPPAEFDAWLATRQDPPPAPTGDEALRGRGVFIARGCVACHKVDGLPGPERAGSPGPDLTDVGARRTLAALTLDNTRANLAAWILDPARFKPGARMPPTRMSGEELRELVSYLEALR